MKDLRRALPSVDRLLGSEPFAPLLASAPRELVVATLQAELGRIREELTGGVLPARLADYGWYAGRVGAALQRLTTGSLLPVLNATGVVLHTNLGRAPLPAAALLAIQQVAAGFCTLEYDLERGGRGSRYVHCRDLLVRLTGAEDALVVNNNAAALVLALNTTARGRDAIISRGELVEIGGAFRVPEIMERSGARLREVGATNRTHAADYRDAIGSQTGALLKVHPSNFIIDGYTSEVAVGELAGIAAAAAVPLIHDVGSGLLIDPARIGLQSEPTPQQSLRAGADLVTMSGDKLMGGPQCGIILGGAHLIGRLRDNPLCRALRVDKLTLAALAATLVLYLDGERAVREIPVLRMLAMTGAELATRAAAFVGLCHAVGITATTVPGTSAVGGGAAPGSVLPTTLILLPPAGTAAVQLERRLRAGRPAVVTRIVGDRVALDLRTVPPDAEASLLDAIGGACRLSELA
jgi:L-seryl-tRNA(Ser) seleniumtransferase